MTNPKYMRPGIGFAIGKTVEEIGELGAALGKSLRWGLDSYNPEIPPDQRETNEQWVRREMQDVRGALDNLEAELDALNPPASPRRSSPSSVHASHSSICYCACPDGPCQHVWDGPDYTEESMVSVTCSRCGTPAIYHDMRCGP